MAPSRSQRKAKQKASPVKFVDNQKVRITKTKFHELRENPDFVALVDVGRIINALLFSMDLTLTMDRSVKTARGRRASARVFVIAASYLHEALETLASFRSRYGSEPFFEKALKLIYPPDGNNRRSRILKVLRNSSGFHLDHERKVTAETLKSLNLTVYDLYSGDDTSIGSLFFDIADTVDLNYWINQFRAEKSEGDTLSEIARTVGEMTKEVLDACESILTALGTRLAILPETR